MAEPSALEGGDAAVRQGWPSMNPIAVGQPSPCIEPAAPLADYRNIPYRPDSIIDGWSDGCFTVRAASLRGGSHRYQGSPRQDDLAVLSQSGGGRLIVAVADGISAASQSHIGASTAVRYASQWLDSSLPEDLSQLDWQALFESAAWSLVQQAALLTGAEEPDPAQAEQFVATTLTCAVAERRGGDACVHLAGVGDSGVWVLAGDRFTRFEGGKDEIEGGLWSSAVVGLPRLPEVIRPVRIDLGGDDVLLVGTDGFGDPLGGGDGEVGGLFAEVLGGGAPSLLEFAHVLDFSRETFDDDRTLVAVWLA